VSGQLGVWAGVAAIVVGAGAGAVFMKGRGPEAAAPAIASAEVSHEEVAALGAEVHGAKRTVADLEDRLDDVTRSLADLRGENARLRQVVERLLAAEARPAASSEGGASGPGTSASAGAAPAVATDATLASASPFGVSEDARTTEIRAVLAKIKAEEQVQEREREKKRELEGAKWRVTQIQERLALTPAQSESLVSLMLERDERQGELRRKVRDGEIPREAAGDAREAAQLIYDAKVQSLLSPEQFAELKKYREEQESGWQQGAPGGRAQPAQGGAPGGGGGRRGPAGG